MDHYKQECSSSNSNQPESSSNQNNNDQEEDGANQDDQAALENRAFMESIRNRSREFFRTDLVNEIEAARLETRDALQREINRKMRETEQQMKAFWNHLEQSVFRDHIDQAFDRISAKLEQANMEIFDSQLRNYGPEEVMQSSSTSTVATTSSASASYSQDPFSIGQSSVLTTTTAPADSSYMGGAVGSAGNTPRPTFSSTGSFLYDLSSIGNYGGFSGGNQGGQPPSTPVQDDATGPVPYSPGFSMRRYRNFASSVELISSLAAQQSQSTEGGATGAVGGATGATGNDFRAEAEGLATGSARHQVSLVSPSDCMISGSDGEGQSTHSEAASGTGEVVGSSTQFGSIQQNPTESSSLPTSGEPVESSTTSAAVSQQSQLGEPSRPDLVYTSKVNPFFPPLEKK